MPTHVLLKNLLNYTRVVGRTIFLSLLFLCLKPSGLIHWLSFQCDQRAIAAAQHEGQSHLTGASVEPTVSQRARRGSDSCAPDLSSEGKEWFCKSEVKY